MVNTYEVTTRTEFAAYIRAYRAAGLFRSYGRLNQFGRSLTTTNGLRIVHRAIAFTYPPMNIHRG